MLELTSQGYSQRQIENMLNISHGTVNNDQTYLRQKAKENIQSYIEERITWTDIQRKEQSCFPMECDGQKNEILISLKSF